MTFPLYSDSESRSDFFSELGTDKFLKRGDTLRHFAALKVSLWHDLDAIMEDAGRLFLHEMRLHYLDTNDVWCLTPEIVARSLTLREQVRKAIAVNHAKACADLARTRAPKVRYTIPTGTKLKDLYLAVLRDSVVELRIDLEARSDAIRELAQFVDES